MSPQSTETVIRAVNARMPTSVTPATRMEVHPSEWMALVDEIERLQILAADYGGQLVAERAETKRLRTAIGHYVRTKLAGAGENAHYWWTLQEIAKESSGDVTENPSAT